MLIKLDLYRIFFQVAQEQSFSQAARVLFLSQPAVSQSIQQLEEELDVRLFNRNSRGVNLTEEGHILYEYVRAALNLISSGEHKLEEFKSLKQGSIAIGVGDTISKHFLLPILETFHEHYPDISFKLVNGTTSELTHILKQGKIDVAFCHFPIEEEAFHIVRCATIQDIFVCGPDYHALLNQPQSLANVLSHPIICLDQQSVSRQFMDTFLGSHGLEMIPDFELGAHDLLLDFASINLGVACVTREFSTSYLESKQLFEIKTNESIPKRGIGLCYLKNVSLSLASQTFVNLVQHNKTDPFN